jgi:tRNA modification GTPase
MEVSGRPTTSPEDRDTIVALATARGIAALAVVRVSGPEAIPLCEKLFHGRSPLSEVPGGRAVTGWLRVGAEDLDQVVATVFRAPHSYTGEDLVEITCHGGAVAEDVLAALRQAGARPARPGEFTKRAFLNGKLDLSQAEAVATLIGARGRAARRAAVRALRGGLREWVEPAYERALAQLAAVESRIEFPEDVETPEGPDVGFLAGEDGRPVPGAPPSARELRGLAATVGRLVERVGRSDLLRRGFRCVLAGPVNVGKSTLFNALLGRDRAIVTEEPGTTRDVLEAEVELDGVPVTFVDTAGLREPRSQAEEEGTRRTLAEMVSADLVLQVRDGSLPAEDTETGGQPGTPFPVGSEDGSQAGDCRQRRPGDQSPTGGLPGREQGVPQILVLNKADLGIHPSWAPWRRQGVVVSARTGEGLEELLSRVEDFLGEAPEEEILVSARIQSRLEDAREALLRAARGLESDGLPELVAADLSDAVRFLGDILGRNVGDDLLEEIFSTFCIGK